jgi:hypothetical protein
VVLEDLDDEPAVPATHIDHPREGGEVVRSGDDSVLDIGERGHALVENRSGLGVVLELTKK